MASSRIDRQIGAILIQIAEQITLVGLDASQKIIGVFVDLSAAE